MNAFIRTLAFAIATIPMATPASAAWVSSYAGDFSGIGGYTFVNVVNVGKKDETITVRFMNEDGTEVTSTSQLLPVANSWTLGSSSAFTAPVTTGDFNGYIRIETTGKDKKLAVFSMVAFPIDGSTAIGNSLAVSGQPVSFVRAK
jgi:hypothetical protein